MSEDHRKKHNVFHWLIVVGKRLLKLIIAVGLGMYFLGFGFSLSKTTLLAFFSLDKLNVVESYFVYIPRFMEMKAKTVDLLPMGLGGIATWWTMVVGIPLMLMGICSILINACNLVLAITDYVYNLSQCPWYNWKKMSLQKIKDNDFRVVMKIS